MIIRSGARGLYVPREVVELYEKGRINGSELMLLVLLDYASNCREEWSLKDIAQFWMKSTFHTSRTISKLRKLGILTTERSK